MENNIQKTAGKKEKNRIKNLISIIILLVGLLIGSFSIDFIQLFRGGGFSQKNLNKTDVFEVGEKTWVAFSEPIVNVQVITDDECEACEPSDILVWSRRVMPTLNAQKVPFDSEEGERIIKENEIKFLPTFIFSESVRETDFYTQAEALFTEKNGFFFMDYEKLGVEPGRYLDAPEINEGDATFGNQDSEVRVVVFSDFQCSHCQSFYKSFREVAKEFEGQAFFSLKHLSLEMNPKSEDAALASFCALEQDKFWEYADKLYSDQARWVNSASNQTFKNYASNLRLNYNQFSECLDSKKYQDKVDESKQEALAFNIMGTPSIFVNDNFQTGAVGLSELRNAIELELNK